MSGERILVVDDDENLRSMLSAALRHHGFVVDAANDGVQGLAALKDSRPDLVVLDVMMPGIDGFEVCRRMRADGDDTPMLFLTARDASRDKVHGLRLGADDYLEKPFSLDELVARIRAILRRSGAGSPDGSLLECGDLSLDDDAHIVSKAGRHVHLSPTEYNLLRYLLLNQGRVVSKPQILQNVWGYGFETDGGVVETYIGYLRRKVDTTQPRLLHTIRGVGYTLRVRP
jgi:two-component system OmpR family response regulator